MSSTITMPGIRLTSSLLHGISRCSTAPRRIIFRRPLSTTPIQRSELKHTPLYDLHVKNRGKMVEFGGHAMPVQYTAQSIVDSSKWTRSKASLFDVSHMTQHKFVGDHAAKFLEKVTPSSIGSLKPFQSTYSAFLNEKAGIVDDTIITNITEAAPTYHVVTNAGNHQSDLEYFSKELEAYTSKHGNDSVAWEVIQNTGLVALQGPLASEIIDLLKPQHQSETFNIDTLTFGNAKWLSLRDPRDSSAVWTVLVSRTGYTGEDGFEISIPHSEPSENTTLELTEAILHAGGGEKVALAGLGARDALRLEAGLCLHGHDITASTTPLDAALVWIIPKTRRIEGAGYNGADVLYGSEAPKTQDIRRVGMILEGRGPAAREGDHVYADAEGTEEIGSITSGAPSPTLGQNIAMGYLRKDSGKAGNPCFIKVRNKLREARIVKMPFVPTKYFKGLPKA